MKRILERPAADMSDSDERLRWIVSALMDGAQPLRIIDRLESSGLPAAAAEAAVEEARLNPYFVAAFEAAAALRQSGRMLAYLSTLGRRSRDAGSVAEVERLSEMEFLHDYYLRNRAVVVRGGAAEWPAVSKWNLEYFRRELGNCEITYRAAPGRKKYETSCAVERTSVARFVDKIDSVYASDDFYHTASDEDRTALSSRLCDDVAAIPFAPHVDVRDPNAHAVWIGPRGTVTPLHFDAINTLFVQVHGSKRFICAPATSHPALADALHAPWSDIDPMLDMRDPRRSSSVPWVELVVGPGDIFFIPAGWWHWVHAEEPSISFTFPNFAIGPDRAHCRIPGSDSPMVASPRLKVPHSA